ncbi:phage tail tube protein [Peptacetobacter hiranonis]|uniref:Phage portal protein n=1 Tax=Peptacetobacter hiranonis (strain DSM 13275 / JCM 10541 / KCTC 15199 / TO-931) TaxID=500633 RepID=B6G003_PEPHT|nr:phage tail tube protein [Peptacetobacter hiranonis]EEA84831.1 hypothetical protein CLOHIR_01457 [Peptacetobacter hiranonis DSM 13275]QEK20762.1 Phage-like element PBSX protein XkdM [Peptacetobacter hiranonis]
MAEDYRAILDATKIQSGTYGELWWDSEYMSEAKAIDIKDEFEKESIKVVRDRRVKHKTLAVEGKGSVTLYKINSFAIKKLKDFSLGNAEEPRFTLMTNLDDPSGLGAERLIFNGVMFDDLTWVKTEVGTLGEIELPFTYESVEIVSLV